jgi:hypothetical protein
MTSHFSISDKVATINAIKNGLLDLEAIFESAQVAGSSSNYVVVNSIPKSGTYLATELIKTFGEHMDIGYHGYTNGISKVNSDGSIEAIRPIPDALWTAALKPGQFCAAHLDYDPILENSFLSRPEHRMIMMIRDPRDLVISWVDFVYNSTSYPKMSPWNAFSRQEGLKSYPDDYGQITSSIENLPGSGITKFFGWLASPACLVVRFEDLFSELNSKSNNHSTPTLQRIADYIGVPLSSPENARSALGQGLTESGRARKIGSYIARMSKAHIEALREEKFQKLVVELGYEPTQMTDQNRALTVEDNQEKRIEELGVELESAKREIEGLRSQIASLTNSTSWRITRPLRALVTALRH